MNSPVMEIDQSLLETLPQEQRQKIVQRMRQEQLRRWQEFDRSESAAPRKQKSSGKKRKAVQFGKNDALLIAINADDEFEGMMIWAFGSWWSNVIV